MKKSFGARRVARKIGGDDDEEQVQNTTSAGTSDSEPPSFVKRPATKSRKSSSLRTSLGFQTEDGSEDSETTGVVTPRRNNLKKVAVQRNAEQRLAADVPFRMSRDASEERPTYSKSMLDELRQSTPNTPANLSGTNSDYEWDEAGESGSSKALDVASKFGDRTGRYQSSAIPTDAEIREKKERRARLAKEQASTEQDFVSLDAASGDDTLDENVTRDEMGRLILKPKEKYAETRLVRDDEDIFEDFDDFTTDGKIMLGRNAEREAETRRKTEMAALIAEAEVQDGSEDEDDSEAERNAAFEAAQTRSGTYATRAAEEDFDRPRTPPRISTIPTLGGVIARLTARLEEMEVAHSAKSKELNDLRAERTQIEKEEVRVQAALAETADKFSKLRESMKITNGSKEETQVSVMEPPAGSDGVQAGPADLFSMQRPARGGLGLGAGSGPGESDDDSDY